MFNQASEQASLASEIAAAVLIGYDTYLQGAAHGEKRALLHQIVLHDQFCLRS